MSKKRLKLKVKNLIVLLLIFLFLVLIGYSGFKIIHYMYNTNVTEELTEELNDYIKISSEDENNIIIDFNKLKEDNPDTVAWLRVNNTNISYPVVKGNDNEYYLKHNFKKKWSESGWIFANHLNRFDGTDDNIVIFGHAMRNKTMFGELNKVLSKEWLDDESNKKIQLITEDGVQIYKIFSIYKIEAEEYYITTKFSESDFEDFKNTIMKRSLYDFKENKAEMNNILTLSTCYDNNNTRLVVHAFKVDNN